MIAVYFRVIQLKALSAQSLLFAAFFRRMEEQTLDNYWGAEAPSLPRFRQACLRIFQACCENIQDILM